MTTQELTIQDLHEQITRLQEENARLKAAQTVNPAQGANGGQGVIAADDSNQKYEQLNQQLAEFKASQAILHHSKSHTAEQLAVQSLQQFQESPFSKEILEHDLPNKLNAPKFDQYAGVGDPTDHIKGFRKSLPLIKEDHLLCLLFQSSLTGPALD
ncbi:hypothetical protein AQUCO_08500012v1 [Aquilegia coerulea]|uniref:Uncharacterized protein n=1 Tax=Aquilegia coerulea TaxID=218851 RepID=A0A2G5C6R3_AQUCA|nr:hypothetical protein AQUCO_08500012v1 [Aquilegia coerulea]